MNEEPVWVAAKRNKLKKEIEYEKASYYFIGLLANDASCTKC